VLSYRLKSAIVGVESCSTGMRVTNIERGTVLTIPDTANETGMVEIVYDSRYISVYLEDIRERGERVNSVGRT